MLKYEAPRQYPGWETFVNILIQRTKTLQQRQLLAPGKGSRIIVLFQKILDLVDYTYLFKLNNDYDRLSRYFTTFRREAESTFSQYATGHLNNDLLVSKAVNYLIPVSPINAIRDLPMDKGYEYWKHMRPFKILSHTSSEYTIDLIDDIIKFSHEPPTGILACLDPIVLCFMYFHYLKYNGYNYRLIDNRTWLHKAVWLPIQQDLIDIFLLRIIDVIVRYVDIRQENMLYDQLNIWLSKMSSSIAPGNQIISSSFNLLTGIQSIKNRTITPMSFLSSNILNQKSVYNYITDLINMYDIESGRQYVHMKYLRDQYVFNICYNICRLNVETPAFRSFLIKLSWHLIKLYNANIWQSIMDQSLRTNVKQSLNEQINQIKADAFF
jgi:hypothetical protein